MFLVLTIIIFLSFLVVEKNGSNILIQFEAFIKFLVLPDNLEIIYRYFHFIHIDIRIKK